MRDLKENKPDNNELQDEAFGGQYAFLIVPAACVIEKIGDIRDYLVGKYQSLLDTVKRK